MLFAGWRAYWQHENTWAGVFLFLVCYWLASLIQAAFDVYLEGPVGGIWHWTLVGVGWGALWIYRWHPEILAEDQDPEAFAPPASPV